MDVPEVWYDHLQRAKEAQSRYDDRYMHRDEVVATSLTATENPREFGDGLNGFDIRVRVTESYGEDALPDQVDGIDVRYVEEEPQLANHGGDISSCMDLHDAYCHNLVEPNPVLGGLPLYVEYWTDTGGDDESAGSLCAIVDHDTKGKLGLTANHVAPSDYADWHQYCDHVGTYEERDGAYDAHFFDYSNSRGVDHKIREDDGSEASVSGYMSETWVCATADGQEDVRQTGTKTGTTIGPLTDCSYNGPYLADGIYADLKASHGDSGGPIYRQAWDGTFSMAGLVTERGEDEADTDCHGHQLYWGCNGPAMYEVVEEMMNDQISFTW